MSDRREPLRLTLHQRTEYRAVLHVTAKELSQLLALKPNHPSVTAVEDDPFVYAPAINNEQPVRWTTISDYMLQNNPHSWLFVLTPAAVPVSVETTYSYFNA